MIDEIVPDARNLRIVKIAGTNGKGSVTAMLDAALRHNRSRVGMFTSPHLQRMTERIRVNGEEIAPQTLESHAETLEPMLRDIAQRNGPTFIPSFFEVLLLIALRVFREADVDWAILEAGIGGGRDAVAALDGPVSAITSIGLDHEDKLGTSLSEIAIEKAGIATQGSKLVIGPSVQPDCVTTIKRHCAIDGDIEVSLARPYETSGVPLTGTFQADNMGTVKALLGVMGEDVDRCLPGVAETRWVGRCEYVGGDPAWLLDGAHNASGISALVETLNTSYAGAERVLIFGASRGKDVGGYAALLAGVVGEGGEVIVVDSFHAGEDAERVAGLLPDSMNVRVWRESLSALVDSLRSRSDVCGNGGKLGEREEFGKLVVVCGSLFLVGAMRDALGLE